MKALLERTITIPSFPKILWIEPNNHCNLKCIMCPRNNSTYPLGFMDWHLFTKIVDECQSHPTLIKLFFLGEPLLHHKLPAMMMYLSSKNLKFAVATNGVLLNKQYAKLLLKYAQSITISFDGINADLYEKIRVGANYQKVVNKVKDLCKLKKKINSKTTIIIATMIPDGSEWSKYLSDFFKIWDGYDVFVSPIEHQRHKGLTWLNGENIVYPKMKKIYREKACLNGLMGLIIRWNGKVTFCCEDINGSIFLGDLNYDGIKDIWHCQQLQEIREKIVTLQYDKNKVCETCQALAPTRTVELPLIYAKKFLPYLKGY